MPKALFSIIFVSLLMVYETTFADELTQIIQKDLIVLGYDPGNIQGDLTPETVVAISKFQAGNDLEITGEPSPQLAGIIKATVRKGSGPGAIASAQKSGAAANKQDAAALEAAQQACLQDKMEKAQASTKKKRGFGSLMKAVANTATRFGGSSMARAVSETSRDIYDVDATARDYDKAAKDLGLTTDDLEACRNPAL